MLTADGTPNELARRFQRVRAFTQALVDPLSEADAQAQSMADASPAKWHLAHTTWFFETFFLARAEPDVPPHDASWRHLFNSYYHGVGALPDRSQRGLITRPGLAEIVAWRRKVDARVREVLQRPLDTALLALLSLGLHHEQQHQELILTDIKHLLGQNPLLPAYANPAPASAGEGRSGLQAAPPLGWREWPGGLAEIGHDGPGFAFDNESPRHPVFLQPYRLADRLVTEGEWAAFIADDGYRDPRWWLSAGWDWLRREAITAPLYWRLRGAAAERHWQVFTLQGPRPLMPSLPVLHVSHFEADAYARWYAARHRLPVRLPTEAEWESAAGQASPAEWVESGMKDLSNLHTAALAEPAEAAAQALPQAFGVAWQWTDSPYTAYPRYRSWDGVVGEYNGKFMNGQQVLRGGSFATPTGHLRVSYRNFFPSGARWQFTGVRLACDVP